MNVLCCASGGIGDEVLTIPAIRYLSRHLQKHESAGPLTSTVEIRIGGWKERQRLFNLLLGENLPVLALEFSGSRNHRFDWIVDFDFRTDAPSLKTPESLSATRGYLSFAGRPPRSNQQLFDLRESEPYWKTCMRMAQTVVGQSHKNDFAPDQTRTLPPDAGIEKKIDFYIDEVSPGSTKLAVTPGGYSPRHKRWPADRFAEVIAHAVSMGITVYVLGSKQELDIAWKIRAELDARPASWKQQASGNISFLTGRMELEEVPYLLTRMDCHLTNDNGVAHIAGLLNLPQIVLYRGTNSVNTPLGSRNGLLFSGSNSDMDGITVDRVTELLDGMLKHPRNG